LSLFKKKKRKSNFSSVNVITNIRGYFCQKGSIHILENKVKDRLTNRILFKKNTISLNKCLNTFLATSLPYIKLKPKKKKKRRKIQKKFNVRWLDRIISKRKAYMNFSRIVKSIKKTKNLFISQLESEIEFVYISTVKWAKSKVNKPTLIEKRDNLHKIAHKFIPYFWYKRKRKYMGKKHNDRNNRDKRKKKRKNKWKWLFQSIKYKSLSRVAQW